MRAKVIKFKWHPAMPVKGAKVSTLEEYISRGWTYEQLIEQKLLVRCK